MDNSTREGFRDMPAEHAPNHLHLTNSLQFNLTDTGYSGAPITKTVQSDELAQAFSKPGRHWNRMR